LPRAAASDQNHCYDGANYHSKLHVAAFFRFSGSQIASRSGFRQNRSDMNLAAFFKIDRRIENDLVAVLDADENFLDGRCPSPGCMGALVSSNLSLAKAFSGRCHFD
jgi:hypothetical protein